MVRLMLDKTDNIHKKHELAHKFTHESSQVEYTSHNA